MKPGDVYRLAAETINHEGLFYARLGSACDALRVPYNKYRRPAVKYYMGDAHGTPDEFALAYLLLAAIVEAPGGTKELTTKLKDGWEPK